MDRIRALMTEIEETRHREQQRARSDVTASQPRDAEEPLTG
jgi:hypothetical protein